MSTLTIAVSSHLYTDGVKSGALEPDGVHLIPVEIEPQIAAYRRMVRELAFDICELSIPTYLAAREAGVPISALPIPLYRSFHHGAILSRPGSGLRSPTDLPGRRVGVRAYTVTTGVWARGLLSDSYGLDLRTITWITDDEEHVQTVRLPSYVQPAPVGTSLLTMFNDGRIDAAFGGNAGLGRSGAPRGSWARGLRRPAEAYPLIANAAAEQQAWYRTTGIYPSNSVIALKSTLVDAQPWLADQLFELFTSAKQPFLDMLNDHTNDHPEVIRFRELSEVVGGDPLPFGLAANRMSFETLARYCCEQDILREAPNLDDVFIPLD